MIQYLLAGASAGLSVASAYSSYKQGKSLNEQYRQQGLMLKAESYRDAQIIREQGIKFAEEQKMAYMGTGVQFAGSALITVTETKSIFRAEASAQERRGNALEKQMFDAGQAAMNEGRASLFKGLFSAGISIAGAMK